MNRKLLIPFLALMAMGFQSSCTSKPNKKEQMMSSPDQNAAAYAQSWQSGVVFDASGLDGCQFLIRTDDGQQLQPVNLDSSYEKDGTKIEFKAELVTDMMSICMAGPMVRITEIRKK